jgi:hypothetical protein
LRRCQSPFQRGALLITGGAGGDQPGARPGLVGSHSQPGFGSGPGGTADQAGTARRPVVKPFATDEPADQPGLFAAPATIDWPDQAGRAVAHTSKRAKPQPCRSGVFTRIDAMLLRGWWLRPLTLGGQRCWRMEPLPVLPAEVVPSLRGPVRRPRGVGLGRRRAQRQRGGCSSPQEL